MFHDDQHGTAIIVGAALLNGLKVVGKDIAGIKLVVSGAGAAALACLDMLVSLGVRMENIIVTDIKGVVYKGRTEEMDDNKARYAVNTAARTWPNNRRSGCVSRPVRRRRAEAGNGKANGGEG